MHRRRRHPCTPCRPRRRRSGRPAGPPGRLCRCQGLRAGRRHRRTECARSRSCSCRSSRPSSAPRRPQITVQQRAERQPHDPRLYGDQWAARPHPALPQPPGQVDPGQAGQRVVHQDPEDLPGVVRHHRQHGGHIQHRQRELHPQQYLRPAQLPWQRRPPVPGGGVLRAPHPARGYRVTGTGHA